MITLLLYSETDAQTEVGLGSQAPTCGTKLSLLCQHWSACLLTFLSKNVLITSKFLGYSMYLELREK